MYVPDSLYSRNKILIHDIYSPGLLIRGLLSGILGVCCQGWPSMRCWRRAPRQSARERQDAGVSLTTPGQCIQCGRGGLGGVGVLMAACSITHCPGRVLSL